MRKKMAMVLVLLMLSSCINVWANTDDSSVSENIENTKVTAEDTDPSEKENHTVEFSTEETLEHLEKASSKESMEDLTQESEKEDTKSEAEETFPLTEENQEKDDNESTLNEESENQETFSSEDNVIYNVSFPANIRVQLDPGNLLGKGQVFSERYKVENFGNTDVTIKIKNIEVFSSVEKESYNFSETEMTEEPFQTKKICVDMTWENKDGADRKVLPVENGTPNEYVIKLDAARQDKDSIGYFYFTGTMNTSPYINWESANIRVTFHYEILSPMDMEEENFEEELENDLEENDQKGGILQKDSITDKQTNTNSDKEYIGIKATESNAQKEKPEIKEIEKTETGETESEAMKEIGYGEGEPTSEVTKEAEVIEEELIAEVAKEMESVEEMIAEATKGTEILEEETTSEASKEIEPREKESTSGN